MIVVLILIYHSHYNIVPFLSCVTLYAYFYICASETNFVCVVFFITLLNSVFHYKEAILHAGDFFISSMLYIVLCVL